MKRSLQEVVELVVFGLVALLVGTALLWVLGWVLSLGGALFKALAGLLWLLLRFIVPIAIVAGLVYFLVKALQGRNSEAAVGTAGAGGSTGSGSPTAPNPVAPPPPAAATPATAAPGAADPVVHDPVITDPAATATDLPDGDVGTPGVTGGVAEPLPDATGPATSATDVGESAGRSADAMEDTADLAADDEASDAAGLDDPAGPDEDEA